MNKKHKAFTLAEVLVTLAIIGVISAILFPSILANFTERTLKAKRQALFGRMSQAMGQLAGQFSKYASATCTRPEDLQSCTDQGSALTFITQGLSSVYKIASACDADSLDACDIPDEITRVDGTIFPLKASNDFRKFNPKMRLGSAYLQYNTDAAAFITKNGESVMVFYNPYCARYADVYIEQQTEDKICVNMIYDLNGGKKKPNKMGQDIGFISVFYGDSPQVVSPRVYDPTAVPDYTTTLNEENEEVSQSVLYTYSEAQSACNSYGDNVVIPSLQEALAIQINYPLIMDPEKQEAQDYMWTSSYAERLFQWIVYLNSGADDSHNAMKFLTSSNDTDKGLVRCVYSE